MLDDAGLVETLKEEVNAWQARQPETSYRLNFSGKLDMLGEIINISIYRIVQECLTNIAKHAMATVVDIKLGYIESDPADRLELEVRDNGAGMDPQSPGSGFGLIGMRERVEALNGEFDYTAAPGTGTRITVRLPLPRKQASLLSA
jgi:hypothetical protein